MTSSGAVRCHEWRSIWIIEAGTDGRRRCDDREVCYELVLGAAAGKKTHLASVRFRVGKFTCDWLGKIILDAVMADLGNHFVFMESVVGMWWTCPSFGDELWMVKIKSSLRPEHYTCMFPSKRYRWQEHIGCWHHHAACYRQRMLPFMFIAVSTAWYKMSQLPGICYSVK